MKTTFIYGLLDPRTKALRYIGKANNPAKRLASHLRDKRASYKKHWILEVTESGFQPYVKIIACVPEICWQEEEIKWIALARVVGCRLTNMTSGGDGGITASGSAHYMWGKQQAKETNEKRSQTMKAVWTPARKQEYGKKVAGAGGSNWKGGIRSEPGYRKAYYQKNKQHIREMENARRREANKCHSYREREALRAREWRAKNPDKVAENNARRRKNWRKDAHVTNN